MPNLPPDTRIVGVGDPAADLDALVDVLAEITGAVPGGSVTVQQTMITLGALANVASTGVTPYTLINGTGNVLSWTTPNDGNMHRIIVPSMLVVSSVQTGGAIVVNFKDPGGTSRQRTQYAGGLAAGADYNSPMYLVGPGDTVTVAQSSAQTAGAATLWAEIWGL